MMNARSSVVAGLALLLLAPAINAAQLNPAVPSQLTPRQEGADQALTCAMEPVSFQPGSQFDPVPKQPAPQPAAPATGAGREFIVAAGSTVGGAIGGAITGGNPIGCVIGSGVGAALAHVFAKVIGW